jgi:transketolase
MNVEIGIESSNGSLGQGVSMACGLALGLKKINSNKNVFCVLGDGECNEGSVWESVQFAKAHNLNNLIFYIDVNGFQNDGATSESLMELAFDKVFDAFGWNVFKVNGHDYFEIKATIERAISQIEHPNVIIGKTVKGNGISFMENNADWHNNVLSEKLYNLAKLELS